MNNRDKNIIESINIFAGYDNEGKPIFTTL